MFTSFAANCWMDPTRRGDIHPELAVDAAGKPLPRRRLPAVDTTKGERAIYLNLSLVGDATSMGKGHLVQRHRRVSKVALADGLAANPARTRIVLPAH